MGGVTNNPLTDEYVDPFRLQQMRRNGQIADLSPGMGGFRPDSGDQYSSFWRSPYQDEMLTPSLAASGSSGQSATAQPQADLSSRGPSAGAGAVLQARSAPPPVPTNTAAATAPAVAPPPVRRPPPGMSSAAPAPPDSATAAPAVQDKAPGPVDLSPQIQDAAARIAQGPPQQKTSGVQSVLQRLGLAVLSATKLAPYAQQIIHPIWSNQMAGYQQAEKDLTSLSTAQETQQRGQYYEGLESGRKEERQITAQGRMDAAKVAAGQHQIQTLLKGREADAIYQPEGGQIPPGYETIQDPLHPGNVYVVPPAFRTLTPELAQYAKGYKTGDVVPYTEWKSASDAANKVSIEQAKPVTGTAAPLAPDQIAQANALFQQRHQNVAPGKPLPPAFQLHPSATRADAEFVDKNLAQMESAVNTQGQRANTLAQQQIANELRRQNMAILQGNRDQKQDVALKQAGAKSFADAMGSAERFNVMAKNYEDAVTNHDQQAMLSLLYNHMGMTMGLQKGARMTQALINEAIKSRPWLQGLTTKFDKDGYLSGVTLSPRQMREMVSNAQGRFGEDIGKARNESQYLGVQDDGPKRTPNQSVVNYYVHRAGNDPVKAKQMLIADGWSEK